MVRHTRNIKLRTIYFFLLFGIYREIFVYFNLSLNLAMYGIFLFLFFSYYLLDTINFNFGYRKANILFSTISNFFAFIIFYFFYKKTSVVYAFLIFSLLQNILNYFLYKKEDKKINTLIIDNDEKYIESIREVLTKSEKYNYCGFLSNLKVDSDEYLGNMENLVNIIKRENIENIVFIKDEEVKKYSDLLVEIKLKGVKVVDYLTFLEEFEGKIDVDKIDSFWVLITNGFDTFNNNLQRKLKRSFDLILALILFICFLPFMAITYIIVKLDIGVKYLILSPKKIIENPAFFKQKRVGFRGNEFEIVKFRSMKVHDPNKYSKYASKNDERITKVGKFIRKTRLDELPQIINVIRGDMSFVGPRPEWNILGREYEKKIKNYNLRYAVQPGITGWAQTMFSYGSSVDDAKIKLEYDLYYVKNQSLILDLIILFKTSKTMIFRKGI